MLVAACAGGETEGPGEAVVRDSAGISIVENTGGSWASGGGWTVSAEPILQLGGDAGDPLKDFSQVTGALQMANGSLAVANSSTSEVRFFDRRATTCRAAVARARDPGSMGRSRESGGPRRIRSWSSTSWSAG